MNEEFYTPEDKSGKEFDIFIDPVKYLSIHHKKAIPSTGFLLSLFQDSIQWFFASFLNGEDMGKSSRILYPFTQSHHRYLLKRLRELKLLCQWLRERDINFLHTLRLLKELNDNPPTTFWIANLISTAYREFWKEKKSWEKLSSTKKIISPSLFLKENYKRRDHVYLLPLFKLIEFVRENLYKELHSAFLHGSMGTIDYVKGWSDIDVFLIVKQEIIFDPFRLLELRKKLIHSLKYFYLQDPFQYHGYFVITEVDMEFYPQSYLPLEVLKFSKSIFTKKAPCFYTRNCSMEKTKALLENYLYLKRGVSERWKYISIYKWKLILHKVLLLPTLYLQVKGIYCYKKFSFPLVRKEVSPELWRVIEIVSSIRENWKYYKKWGLDLAGRINPWNPWWLQLPYLKLKIPGEKTVEIAKEISNFAEFLFTKAWRYYIEKKAL